ncbi:hypothetical protein BB558_007102, partial [Smittium angustum]
MNNDQPQTIESFQVQLQGLTEAIERIQATSNQVEAAKIERIYATNGESYKHGNWDLNPHAHRWIQEHDCEHRLVSQSVSSIKIRHPAPSGGYFKSYELNKSIKLNSQAAKEDKQLSEAKQQALNLARIGIHIEELSRSFAQISTPNESKVNIVAEEINGSAQDLLRLAFSYAHKWRTSRRIGVAQSSGYDKDTAVSVPEGENPEAQYLFHPKTLEQMDRTIDCSEQLSPTANQQTTKDLQVAPTPVVEEVQPTEVALTTVEGTTDPATARTMVTDHSSTATTGLTVQQATPQILQRGFKGARERIKSSKNWIVRKKS